MTVSNDDMPHPIPPTAYLRYKENWFFLIFDKDNDVFGAVHLSAEPIFDRISFACHLSVKGKLFKYGNQIPIPEEFAFSRELGDGRMTVRFVKAHEQIDLSLHNDELDLSVSFSGRSPLFDFDDFDSANPEKVTLKEVTALATNQQTLHQQQSMYVKGSLAMKSGDFEGDELTIDALGYRDHSRSIRSDNLVHEHIWTGWHFANHVFGVMSVTSSIRPHQPVICGYVFDDESGLRSLRDIEIEEDGIGPDGQPGVLRFLLSDIYGETFTLSADLDNRYASVPLQSEKPGPTPFVYDIVENFAPLKLVETGEAGIGLIEIGKLIPKG